MVGLAVEDTATFSTRATTTPSKTSTRSRKRRSTTSRSTLKLMTYLTQWFRCWSGRWRRNINIGYRHHRPGALWSLSKGNPTTRAFSLAT